MVNELCDKSASLHLHSEIWQICILCNRTSKCVWGLKYQDVLKACFQHTALIMDGTYDVLAIKKAFRCSSRTENRSIMNL